jgi:amidase
MRASRAARPAPLEGALWLDEPFASVDATVAAVLKAALMLAEVGPIVDESARPAFSFGEAWEVFAVLTMR